MAVVPAVALGALVVFSIGYGLSQAVLGKIADKIEARQRRKTGLIPPVDYQIFDINSLSIAGGIVAVVLVLILWFAVPRESKVIIWYVLTGIGIVAGLLTFILFRSESDTTEPTKTLPSPTDVEKQELPSGRDKDQNRPGSKDDLYKHLLSLTKNDRELANRLIEYERKRKPDASEEELIRRAIERWELDNR